jgi:3-oxoadipate enol-lactonase
MPTLTTVLGPVHVDVQGTADRPTALLWPSLFSDHHMWHHQVAALNDDGWRTLALDPPGHGRSPGVGRTFTMDECAEVVLQVLDDLDTHSPVAFLGTSWGGFIAPRVALRAPDRISAVVMFNTSAERGNPLELAKARILTRLMGLTALDAATDRLIMAGLLAPGTRGRYPDIAAELTRRLRSWDRRSVIRTVRSVLIDRTPTLDALPHISTPTLVVSGAQDHTLPTIHSLRIVEKLLNARHVQVAGAAHLIPLEAPAEATALIRDFLEHAPAARRTWSQISSPRSPGDQPALPARLRGPSGST